MIEVTDDRARVDRAAVYAWLADAYWSKGRTSEVVDLSIENSHVFSAWDNGEMVGFARVVTDYATFSWLCDVIVHPEKRGRGVGHALMDVIMNHPRLAHTRWMLGTRDAHSLYAQYGFIQEDEVDRWMTKNFKKRPPRE